MSLEVELKLTLTEPLTAELSSQIQQRLQALTTSCQAMPETPLLNAYFETADQWFRQHDCGLRTRLKRGRYEQTIKLAGQQHGAAHIRPEYNVPCDSVEPKLAAFPAEIWPTGTDVLQLQQQLQELFRTDFIRRGWLLTLADGSVVEAVLDQGQVRASESAEPILELELELVKGDAAVLFELAQQLVQQFPLQLGFQSKAERGYRLAQQQPLQLLQVAPDATLSALLRAVQQNLWLLQQQMVVVDAATELLQQQQQQLQATLQQASATPQLWQQLPLFSRATPRDCAAWLLQLSWWMYQQSQQGH
jgi:triphosphatase